MTTADKKRILSLPIVKGKIKFNSRAIHVFATQILSFENRLASPFIIKEFSRTHSSILYDVEKNHLKVFDVQCGFIIEAFIKYSDFEIQWCSYPGLDNNLPKD